VVSGQLSNGERVERQELLTSSRNIKERRIEVISGRKERV
jgi:hypothetical protein